jgi:hypothetical protein
MTSDDALYVAWMRIAIAMNAMCPPGAEPPAPYPTGTAAYRTGMLHALNILADMGALAREGRPATPRMLEDMEKILRGEESPLGKVTSVYLDETRNGLKMTRRHAPEEPEEPEPPLFAEMDRLLDAIEFDPPDPDAPGFIIADGVEMSRDEFVKRYFPHGKQ